MNTSFRKVKNVYDTIESNQSEQFVSTYFDSDLIVDGWEKYRRPAEKLHERYCHFIQYMLDQYGIQNEAQLISGHMVSVRNRITQKEKDDFSVNKFFVLVCTQVC